MKLKEASITILDSVAQLVEQYTFNVWALGSNPSGITEGARDSAFFVFMLVKIWIAQKKSRI